tara:strand:- start:593 stop:841 length:249 start_codon:yes stop_codon:yes gene_type:complete
MKNWKPKIILIGMLLSFVAACFNVMSGLYIAVLTNTFCNYVVISRQKAKTVVVKKKKAMTVDEFREREINANPHRAYPSLKT